MMLAAGLLVLWLAQETAVFKVETRVVNITFSAVGARDGNLVADLKREEVRVFEDGKERVPSYFARESDLPLTLGIIVDLSGSQRGLFRKNLSEALSFLRHVLKPQDEVFIVTFGEGTRLVQDRTRSLAEIEALFARWDDAFADAPLWSRRRGSPVFSSVMQAVKRRMVDRTGRKAILLISDGIDMRSSDEPNDVTEKLQSADTMLYWLRTPAMMPGRRGRQLQPLVGEPRVTKRVRKMAEESGGRAFPESSLAKQFRQIEAELRTQYAVGFPPSREADGKVHKLKLETKRAGVKLRHKPSYRDEP